MLPLTKRPALWLLPIFLIVAFIYVGSYTELNLVLGNSAAAVSGASSTLLFSCLLASICAAIESSRERNSRGITEVTARGYLWRILDRLWPSVVAAALIQVAIVAYLVVSARQFPEPKLWLVVLGYLLAIMAHSSFGYLLGQWFPSRFAIPLALVLSYLFLAFTGASGYFPAHYLSGMTLNGCCMAAQSLDYRGVWTLIVFSLLATGGFLSLASNKNPLLKKKSAGQNAPMIYAIGTSLLVLSLIAGLFISRDIDGIAVVNDDARQLTCTGTGPQVCLNDVQRFGGDRSDLVARSVLALSQIGFPKAKRVTAELDHDARVAETGELVTSFEPWYTDEQVVYAASSSYSAEIINHLCENGDFDKQYQAFEILQDWTTSYALHKVLGSDAVINDEVLGSKSFEQQRAWVLRTYKQLSRCEVPTLPQGLK